MLERLLAVSIHQTGTAVDAAWVLEFPFPTQLWGIKACGSNDGDTTITVAGAATVAATAVGDDGDPAWITPDTVPDYADADSAYTVTLTKGSTGADDPYAIFFFWIGDGGANHVGMSENIICVPVFQTGDCTAADWVIEFPFPTQFLGVKHSGSNGSKTSTIEIADGAVMAATTIGNSGDPTWSTPTTVPDYAAADAVYTVTFAAGTAIDDPMCLLFFAVGEGGTNYKGMSERIQVTNLFQTGAATTGGWVQEFPVPTQYLGHKGAASATSTTTITLAGGVVDAAAAIGTTGDPLWLTPTTVPDYCAKDTVVTMTLTQTATRGDDPMVVSVWQLGEG